MSKTPTEQAIDFCGYELSEPLNGLNLVARDQYVGFLAGHAAGVKDTLALAEKLAKEFEFYAKKRLYVNVGIDADLYADHGQKAVKALEEFKLAKGKVTT